MFCIDENTAITFETGHAEDKFNDGGVVQITGYSSNTYITFVPFVERRLWIVE